MKPKPKQQGELTLEKLTESYESIKDIHDCTCKVCGSVFVTLSTGRAFRQSVIGECIAEIEKLYRVLPDDGTKTQKITEQVYNKTLAYAIAALQKLVEDNPDDTTGNKTTSRAY